MNQPSAEKAKRAKANALSHDVIGAATEVHRVLGPGRMESTHEQCLAYERHLRDLPFYGQKAMSEECKDVAIACDFRIDLLSDECPILERKAVKSFSAVHETQLPTSLANDAMQLGTTNELQCETNAPGHTSPCP